MCVWTLSQRRKCSLESSSWVDGGVCCAVLGDGMVTFGAWGVDMLWHALNLEKMVW